MACISASEVMKQTRMGRFSMGAKQSGPLALLKKLRGKSKPGGRSAGAGQMRMLRQIPRILRFIPGTAQDVRAYFIAMQYWLAGSEENLAGLVRYLVNRYATGARAPLAGAIDVAPPRAYPDTGLYHPRLATAASTTQCARITDTFSDLPIVRERPKPNGTVGLLVMRSYVLANDARHYDGVINALEARGLNVIPAFASGLDARPAIEQYFLDAKGTPRVNAVLSLTGFSLVGGPAYNDSSAAADILGALDVPYLSAHALEFQSLEEWRGSARGLMPIESTIMIAIPEIDGATAPTVFGGRSAGLKWRADADADGRTFDGSRTDDPATTSDDPATPTSETDARAMRPCPERVNALADRVAKLVALRRSERAERRLAIVLFNFPPNAGATGTAAFLAVFESLHNTLIALRDAGYTVDVPDTVDDLRRAVLDGNAAQYGSDANVMAEVSADDHVRREPHLEEIEAQWGPAPGRIQTDGRAIHILGRQFGNVAVTVQPGFGYEGDPMRLLFEGGFAPTHA
ncbi:MAG: cobaltochelatase subunit CobN, partial [Pseudomonadota bacterium]